MGRSQREVLDTKRIKLKAVLANCKQEGDSVAYYSRLRKLWDELRNYTQLPVSKITSIIVKEREEEEQVYQFFYGT